jgi:hypothetical protein
MINSALNRLHHDAAVTPRHGTRSFSKTFRVGFTVLKVKRAMKNSIYFESQSDPHGTYPSKANLCLGSW